MVQEAGGHVAVAASPGTVRDGRGQGLPQKPQYSWREDVSCAHSYTDAQRAPPCTLGAASGPDALPSTHWPAAWTPGASSE